MSGLWNKILKSRKGSHRAKWVIHVTGSVERKLDLCIIRLSETNRPTSHLQKRYLRLHNFTTQVIKIWIQPSNLNHSPHRVICFVAFGNRIRSRKYGITPVHWLIFHLFFILIRITHIWNLGLRQYTTYLNGVLIKSCIHCSLFATFLDNLKLYLFCESENGYG